MLLLPAFIVLLQVVICKTQWSAYTSTSQEATTNSCNDGDTRPFGNCSPRFLRCRCDQWTSAVCPGTSIFDEQTQLCIFSECNTVTTPSSVYPVTIPSIAYTTTPGSYPTAPASTFSTIDYPTEAPITVEYHSHPPPPEPITAGYPTALPITAGYPTEQPATVGYSTADPVTAAYPTPEPVTAGYPNSQPITAGYHTEQPATVGYPTEQPATAGYSTAEPVTAAYPTPEHVPAGYPTMGAVTYGAHVPNVLSNPFFVERRHGRHHRYRHKSDEKYRHNADEEVNMRRLPARSMPVRVNSRSQYMVDAFRAHDSKKLLSSSWDVFPRSRVYKKWSERRRKYDEEDEDFELRAASRLAEPVQSTELSLEETPLTDVNDVEGSGVSEIEPFVPLTADAEFTPAISESSTRRKRSYSLPDQESQSIRCKGVADNSVFSMGFCAQNFVVCKSSLEIMAACPVGDLFDFGVARCVPASVCGVSNADICATEITTTTAASYISPTSNIPETTTAESSTTPAPYVPPVPVPTYSTADPYTESTQAAYTPYGKVVEELETVPVPTSNIPATTTAESSTTRPPYMPPVLGPSSNIPETTTAESSTTPALYMPSTTVPTYSTMVPNAESTQATYAPYGKTVEEQEVITRPSPPAVIYVSVSSNRSEFCVGRGDALYRDPQACSGIIQCHGGEMFQHNGCPSGLVFNERKQQCDYKNQVPECDRMEENPAANLGCKGAQHGAYLPDETDCKIFYRCVWNRLEKMNCPAGTFFNPTLSVCDWPANVKCPAAPSADRPMSPY